jgi:branched-chain amino acid transport system permease protein
MGSVAGVSLAAVGITVLPELFREFGNYRMLVFGLAMVLIMVWRPQGLLGVARRSIERPDAP